MVVAQRLGGSHGSNGWGPCWYGALVPPHPPDRVHLCLPAACRVIQRGVGPEDREVVGGTVTVSLLGATAHSGLQVRGGQVRGQMSRVHLRPAGQRGGQVRGQMSRLHLLPVPLLVAINSNSFKFQIH